MAVSVCELAGHLRRIADGERHLVMQYWLVRVAPPDGLGTFVVLCSSRELSGARLVHHCAEAAGLGTDEATARGLYGRIVAGDTPPTTLAEVVADARSPLASAPPRLPLAAAAPQHA